MARFIVDIDLENSSKVYENAIKTIVEQFQENIVEINCIDTTNNNQFHEDTSENFLSDAQIQSFHNSIGKKDYRLDKEKQLKKIENIAEKHQDVIRTHYAMKLPEQIEKVLEHYLRKAEQSLNGAMTFRDKMVLQLTALNMCLEMTGNAGTHAEKGARLRGALEIIESTIQDLENEDFTIDEFSSWWRVQEGLSFRPKYPVSRLLDKIERLESDNEQLKLLNGGSNNIEFS